MLISAIREYFWPPVSTRHASEPEALCEAVPAESPHIQHMPVPANAFPFLDLPDVLQDKIIQELELTQPGPLGWPAPGPKLGMREASKAFRSRLPLAGLYIQSADDLSQAIARFPQAKHLSLAKIRNVSDLEVCKLPALGNLTSVDLTVAMHHSYDGDLKRIKTSITASGMEYLARLKNLIALNLSSQWKIADSDLTQLSKLKLLKYLDLSTTGLTDAAILDLKDITSLSSLSLSGNYELSGNGLERLKDLESLDLSYTNVTDSTIAGLQKLCKLVSLSLSSNFAITGAGLSRLIGLKHLAVQSCRINGAGFEEIATLKNLVSLKLGSNQLSDVDVGALRHALPSCRITCNF